MATPAHPLPPNYALSPMQRIETAWRPPWIICRMAQQGLRHFNVGGPSDDNHTVGGARDATWMVLADGVSTAPRSRFGSAIACQAVEHHLGRRLTDGETPSRAMLIDAMEAAHDAVHRLAKFERHPAGTYATTLCIAIIKGDLLITATLGDSSVAVATEHESFEDDAKPELVLSPFCTSGQADEAGATFSIHDPMWRSCIATNESANPAITALFLATDGGHNFFLDDVDDDAHEFDPAYPVFLMNQVKSPGPLQLAMVFDVFVRDVEAENKDDRTLLIAYRAPQAFAPPAPAA